MTMIRHCFTCGEKIHINKFKGINQTYLICSMDCFLDACKVIGSDYSFDINSKKNSGFKSYRSSVELSFAQILKSNGVKFEYEKYYVSKNIRGTKRYYLPDFFLPDYNIFIEIKGGIWENNSYSKYKEFVKTVPVYLVTPEIMKFLKKKKNHINVQGQVHNE